MLVSTRSLCAGLGLRADNALDLIGLYSLMGNDYIPKAKGCSFERLWRAYGALTAAVMSSPAREKPVAERATSGVVVEAR